jgi:hypothetical protein
LLTDIRGIGPKHLLFDVGFTSVDLKESEVILSFDSYIREIDTWMPNGCYFNTIDTADQFDGRQTEEQTEAFLGFLVE